MQKISSSYDIASVPCCIKVLTSAAPCSGAAGPAEAVLPELAPPEPAAAAVRLRRPGHPLDQLPDGQRRQAARGQDAGRQAGVRAGGQRSVRVGTGSSQMGKL